MENSLCNEKEDIPGKRNPFYRVGIIYFISPYSNKGRKFEKVAENEVAEVARAIKAALQEKGYEADMINLDPACVPALKKYDWIFNLLEPVAGIPVSDIDIVEQMEEQDIHFTGAGTYALKACIDKSVTKAELQKYGIPSPVYDVFNPGDRILTRCKFPIIVKPVHEDGSVGISKNSIAYDGTRLASLVERIHKLYHQAALVEEYIDGREINAAILGNGNDAIVLPLSEITYASQDGPKILTFKGKWEARSAEYRDSRGKCPCNIEPDVEARIKETALKAYHILRCRDYARVDFRLRDNIPYVLEVNPNPCLNPQDAGFARSGRAAGFTYTELINRILEVSVKNIWNTAIPVNHPVVLT